MRKNLLLIGIVLLIAAGLTLWMNQSQPKVVPLEPLQQSNLEVSAAADFTLKDLKGKEIKLSEFKGKIVILHFWATWCPPCIAELPKLVNSVEKAGPEIHLLALSADLKQTDIEKFLKKASLNSHKDNIHIALDKGRKITHDLYQTFTFPETIIIDREGNMVRKIAGDADWTSPEMKSYLSEIASPLADKPSTP